MHGLTQLVKLKLLTRTLFQVQFIIHNAYNRDGERDRKRKKKLKQLKRHFRWLLIERCIQSSEAIFML